eukprot:1685786-Pleurochrysis_carterae.AAC.1
MQLPNHEILRVALDDVLCYSNSSAHDALVGKRPRQQYILPDDKSATTCKRYIPVPVLSYYDVLHRANLHFVLSS